LLKPRQLSPGTGGSHFLNCNLRANQSRVQLKQWVIRPHTLPDLHENVVNNSLQVRANREIFRGCFHQPRSRNAFDIR
jgi:hypothetical protein